MTDIANEFEIINFLKKISIALKTNDEPAIYSVIDTGGFDLIFSEKSIGLARAMRDVRLTVFLLSIAKENNIEGKNNVHWMTIYNSINRGVYPEEKLNYITDLILKSVIDKNNALNDDLNKVNFNNFSDLNLDLELAIDFRRWSVITAILSNLPTTGSGLYHWLHFLKIIVERQKFIANVADGKNFSEIYKLIIKKLSDVDAVKSSLNAIKLLHANSLQISGDVQAALLLYEELHGSNKSVTIMMEKARCYSKMKSYCESIKQLDLLIDVLLDNYSKGDSSPLLLQTPADLNYSKNNAISAYSDIVSLAEIIKAELFMVSGTLLGYCRISDFLPNDKDLDFGLIGLENLPRLVDLALKSGLFQINPEYFKGEDTIQVPFIHVQTGIWIDVFIYHDTGDKFMTGVDFQFGYRQTFEFSKFHPIKVDFHNLKTYTPSNFEENLSENFGNWKEPDVNYISHVESPSIMDYGGIPHQLTYRFWLIRAIQSKSIEKLNKLIKVSSKISLFNNALKSEVINSLINYKNSL
jgi:hypothetical protein